MVYVSGCCSSLWEGIVVNTGGGRDTETPLTAALHIVSSSRTANCIIAWIVNTEDVRNVVTMERYKNEPLIVRFIIILSISVT